MSDIELAGIDLAAFSAYAGDPSKHHFLRSREICDPEHGVRVFEHLDETWFLKARNRELAQQEIANASQMARMIDGLEINGVTFKVGEMRFLEFPDGEAAVLSRDFGPTLHSTKAHQGLETTLARALEALWAAGIEWKGFVPRNLIYNAAARSITLIDFESVVFHDCARPRVKSSTKLKLKLNWMQVWPTGGALDETIEAMSVRDPVGLGDLDDFERTLVALCDGEDELGALVRRCDAATIVAEAPDPLLEDRLTPMEIGHALDEALDDRVSVFLLFLFAAVRRSCPDRYTALMRELGDELSRRNGVYDRASLRTAVCAAMDAAEADIQVTESHARFQSLRTAHGLDAAVRRASHMDALLSGVERCIWLAFPFLTRADLILRGSSGQGVLSAKSDVDFELSSPTRPGGWPEMEALVVELLALLTIEAEGSQQRPEEKDLLGFAEQSRDANEWSQLRRPGGDGAPDWLRDLHPNADRDWWRTLSQYETHLSEPEALSPAYLFKAARATVARAAASLGCSAPVLSRQLDHVERVKGAPTAREMRYIVERALFLRESRAPTGSEINDLTQDISLICETFAIPDPFSAEGVKGAAVKE